MQMLGAFPFLSTLRQSLPHYRRLDIGIGWHCNQWLGSCLRLITDGFTQDTTDFYSAPPRSPRETLFHFHSRRLLVIS
jgi:hypothetical protein